MLFDEDQWKRIEKEAVHSPDDWRSHADSTGHCSFSGDFNGHWICMECGCQAGEVTIEQVLGKAQASEYQQAYKYIHSKQADLSTYLDLGDSWHAHGMGITLT